MKTNDKFQKKYLLFSCFFEVYGRKFVFFFEDKFLEDDIDIIGRSI